MDYYAAIDRVLDHIESSLFQPHEMSELAETANMSKYHFQRVFRYIVGTPVASYIKLRRLYLASRQLRSSRQTILEIALAHGFSCHEVFSRAFQKQYGLNPAQYRDAPLQTPAFERPDLLARQLHHQTLGSIVSYDVIELPQMVLGGLQALTSPDDNIATISRIWSQLLAQQAQFSEQADLNAHYSVLGTGFMLEPFIFFAGFELHQHGALNPNYVYHVLPAQTYMRFTHIAPTHNGFTDHLEKAMELIFAAWMPQSGFQLAELGFDVLVRTDERTFAPNCERAQVELLLPIQAE